MPEQQQQRRFGLIPTLTTAELDAARTWLRNSLANARLCAAYPLGADRLAIYIDGHAKVLRNGRWGQPYDAASSFCVGQDDPTYSLIDRLSVLSCVIGALDLWESMVDEFSNAVSRIMLESYNEMMGGLLAGQGLRAVGLAFNADQRQVAARMGETWHLPNGQEVDLAAPEWTNATVVQ